VAVQVRVYLRRWTGDDTPQEQRRVMCALQDAFERAMKKRYGSHIRVLRRGNKQQASSMVQSWQAPGTVSAGFQGASSSPPRPPAAAAAAGLAAFGDAMAAPSADMGMKTPDAKRQRLGSAYGQSSPVPAAAAEQLSDDEDDAADFLGTQESHRTSAAQL